MDRHSTITYMHCMSKRPTFKALGGWRGLMRNPGLFLLTLRRGGAVGEDAAGNYYFEQRVTAKGRRARRWVVYAGAAEASEVAPEWHSWLHYTTDAPLDRPVKPWQKAHLPNLTGTAGSYRPAGHDYQGGKTAEASADYESWSP